MEAFVVVFDRAHARFFEVSNHGAIELPSLSVPSTRGGRFHSDREDSPGWGEHHYHGRIAEETRREFAAIKSILAGLERRLPRTPILLAAPGNQAAALWRSLSPALVARVMGTAKLNPTEVTPAQVAQTVRRLRPVAVRSFEKVR